MGGSSTLYYLFNDHLGSSSVLSNSSGVKISGSEARYLPFGAYRTAPTTNPSVTDRGFTGQKHNDSLGLIYYNARFYAPSIGRFLSADTIVPNPTNPQSLNRYSYVRNSPLNFTDPTGHRECELEGNCEPPKRLPTPSKPSPSPSPAPNNIEPPSDLITHLPLDRSAIIGQSGFGPNWFSTYSDKCNQGCYPQSHNIHTGLDFFAPAGSTVYATVSGKIVAEYDTDGIPNVVIEITVGEFKFYVVHGHVKIADGMMNQQVEAGVSIGTIVENGNHVHLGLRLDYTVENRAYNPLLFMAPKLLTVEMKGMSFVSDNYPYYGNESPTSIRSFLYGTGSYYDEANRNSMGIIR